MRQVLARRFGRCSAAGEIEMPSNWLANVLHLDRQIGVKAATYKGIIAGRPIAIESKFIDVHDEQVARHGALDVERASLRVAPGNAADIMFISTAGIYRGGVDRVARR